MTRGFGPAKRGCHPLTRHCGRTGCAVGAARLLAQRGRAAGTQQQRRAETARGCAGAWRLSPAHFASAGQAARLAPCVGRPACHRRLATLLMAHGGGGGGRSWHPHHVGVPAPPPPAEHWRCWASRHWLPSPSTEPVTARPVRRRGPGCPRLGGRTRPAYPRHARHQTEPRRHVVNHGARHRPPTRPWLWQSLGARRHPKATCRRV